VVYVESEDDEGLYNLYFHNCQNYKDGSPVALNFTVSSFWYLQAMKHEEFIMEA